MRRMMLLGSVAVGIGALWACTPPYEPFCPNGVFPFDGQSSVAADAVIVIQTGSALPEDLPSIEAALTLTTDHGYAVPFRARVDSKTGEIRVIPDRPLQPDTRYELGAVDWAQLDEEVPHWWSRDVGGRDYTVTTFSTASEPQVIDVHPAGDDATLVVAFSEPVDLDSLAGRLWLVADRWAVSGPLSGAAGPIDLEVQVLGTFEGDDHLVWIQPVEEVDVAVLDQLRLDEGAISRSGRPATPGTLAVTELEYEDPGELQRYSGSAYCLSMDW